MTAFNLDIRIWVEYIDSKGNWSDDISREFDRDPFWQENNYACKAMDSPFMWFTADILDSWSYCASGRGLDTALPPSSQDNSGVIEEGIMLGQ